MTLEPIDKAFIVLFLGSCTGRAKRLARWSAYGVITDAETVRLVGNLRHVFCAKQFIVVPLQESYGDLPDLSLVLSQLRQANQTGNKFEYNDDTDFDAMVSYIQILGVALTNIP